MTGASTRALWGGLLLVAGLLLAVGFRLQPPAVRPAEAPLDVFSAARAAELRARMLEGVGPHRVGSPANALLRERLLAHLRGLGYAPEVQEGFACGTNGVCAPVSNLLVRVPGTGPRAGERHAVMLAAHYDSVGAGPGASDDFNGTAVVLEVARVLKSRPPPRNDVLLLLTDGEESGLLGARAFTRHPWAREVLAVVNVEARGTSGPSLMFQTGPDNAWLVELYARHVPRPATGSLFTAVYKRMPNDTDFTVFQEAGLTGLNLANIGDVVHYHTALDDVANSDPRTLQHHGDSALALMTALATEDLSTRRPGDAVFLDVLGLAVVRWPLGLSPWLGALGLGLVVATLVRGARRAPLPRRELAWATAGVWGLVLLCALVGLAVSWLLRVSGAAPVSWVAYPQPALAACALLVLATFLRVGTALAPRAGAAARWGAVWLGWGLLAFALTLLFPEGSALFLLPVLVAGGAGLLAPVGEGSRAVAALAGTALAAVVLLPVCLLLLDSLGLPALVAVAALAGWVLATLLPVVPTHSPRARLLTWGLGALGVLLALGALAVPPYSRHAPQRLNVVYRFDSTRKEARWSLEGDLHRIPEPLAEFRQGAREHVTPWARTPNAVTLATDAPPFLPPEVEQVQVTKTEGGRVLELRLRSTRGAPRVVAALPPSAGVTAVRVNGERVPLSDRARVHYRGWYRVACVTAGPEGCVLELTQQGSDPIELLVSDESPGLPPGRAARAAPWPDFVPFLDGDVTVTTRTVWL